MAVDRHTERPSKWALSANGQDIRGETFGDRRGPAVLLIMGNSAPGLVWPDAFCALVASHGYFVVRFDQRDSGLSSYVDFDRQPYTLFELADDAAAILDGLGISQAHIVGLSQGGVVAYRIALARPGRVLSVSTIMSSPDLRPKNDAFTGVPAREGALPGPAADYVAKVIALNASPAISEAEIARRFVDNFRLAKGPRSPFAEGAWHALGQAVAALPSLREDGLTAAMANNSNNARAQMATPSLEARDLAALTIPVLVIHGGRDPIFPIAHARWAVGQIPDAQLVELADMGHALDPAFFDVIAGALTDFWNR